MATGTKVEDLQALNSAAVLKFQIGGILLADDDALVPDIESLINPDGTINKPAGYVPTGWITEDAINIDRSMSVDTTKGWQSLAIIRIDLTEDAIAYKIKFMETNVATFAVRQGLSLAEAKTQFTPDAGYAIKRNSFGSQPSRRALVIARDTLRNVTLAQVLPSVALSAAGSDAIGRKSARELDATLSALYDGESGTDVLEAIGGPGVKNLFLDQASGVARKATAKA